MAILCITLILFLSSLIQSDAKVEEMDKLEWEKDIASEVGEITISPDGKEVLMKGNWLLQGKNAIYMIPENHQEQTLQFTYNVDYGDSFWAAGVLLNVKKEGNQLKGYMLSFNNDGSTSASDVYDMSKKWYNEAGNNLRSSMDFYI